MSLDIDKAALDEFTRGYLAPRKPLPRHLQRPRRSAYVSPIDLPTGKSGPVELSHRYLTGSTPLVGQRQAIMRGIPAVTLNLSHPLLVHELSEDGHGLWMTDLPEELNQIDEAIRRLRPRGRVLVGGLGLGVWAARLVMEGCQVHVVERSEHIIKLCYPNYAQYSVTHGDIGEFLREHRQPFDLYMLDTWQGTSEGTWWEEVMPLRRAIANRHGRRRVFCWAEDIMLGQVNRSAFYQAGKGWYYEALEEGITVEEVLRFTRTVGLKGWERRWGAAVDRVTKKRA